VARLFRHILNAPLRQSHSAAPARVQPQQSFASVFERVSVGSAHAPALLRCVMPNVDALLFDTALRWACKDEVCSFNMGLEGFVFIYAVQQINRSKGNTAVIRSCWSA
jgi:hypothetical protein